MDLKAAQLWAPLGCSCENLKPCGGCSARGQPGFGGQPSDAERAALDFHTRVISLLKPKLELSECSVMNWNPFQKIRI